MKSIEVIELYLFFDYLFISGSTVADSGFSTEKEKDSVISAAAAAGFGGKYSPPEVIIRRSHFAIFLVAHTARFVSQGFRLVCHWRTRLLYQAAAWAG